LTRIRERSGLAVFRRFFAVIVEQCITAGLVWGRERSVDATKVAANAALDSRQPRFAVEAHLHRLFASGNGAGDGGGGPEDLDEPGGDNPPARLPIDLTAEARSELAERALQRHDLDRPSRSP
jgi:hypothetical protein